MDGTAMFDTEANHVARLRRVMEFIHDHLDEPLDLIRLAEIACFSPYHWHRIYSAFHGESVFETVQRLRLQRAAAELLRSEASIAIIAKHAGYGGAAAFSRAFTQKYGESPKRFRAARRDLERIGPQTIRRTQMPEIELRNSPSLRLAAMHHTGDYMEISRAFNGLISALAASSQLRSGMTMVGVYFSDPRITPVEQRRSLAGVLVDPDFAINDPLTEFHTEKGPLAVLTHKGPYADLPATYDWLYGVWLPDSGREPADAPSFEVYLNSPMDTRPVDLLTEICVPLQPATGAS
jgi:AraC family transcriptional regulator